MVLAGFLRGRIPVGAMPAATERRVHRIGTGCMVLFALALLTIPMSPFTVSRTAASDQTLRHCPRAKGQGPGEAYLESLSSIEAEIGSDRIHL